jgi:CRISPR-associated protein Csb2
MTAIQITFPAGRFHATPWGRHVNEGAVEWPPSPWRLLRALIATWKTKAPEIADDTEMRGLLENLSRPPEFCLPPATFSHTRHYMPWFKNGRTLIFDSFVAVAKDAPITIFWPDLELSDEESLILATLLPLLGTLGRSESWCEAHLLEPDAAAAISPNCRTISGANGDDEVVRVLGVDPETAFQNDRNPWHNEITGKGKTKTTKRISLYDPDWHICMETLWLHQQRMSMPPGTRWLGYVRRKDALAQPKTRGVLRSSERPSIQVARFALDSAVLPLVTETLRIAEAARGALMSRHGWIAMEGDTKGKSAVFSGKHADGSPLTDHSHAYYLPTDEDGDGRLDHLTVVATAGFPAAELQALDSLRQIKTKESEESGHPMRVILTGLGRLDEFTPGPMKPVTTWVSATPYLSHRHPKTRGSRKDSPEELVSHAVFVEARLKEDIARLLERRDDLKDISIDQIKVAPCMDENGVFRLGARGHRPIEFQRFRRKPGDDGGKRLCGAFAIEFPRAVRGPLALGHSCHYGMGLFLPWDENDFETYKAMCARHPRLSNFTEEHLRMLHFRWFVAHD